LHHLQLIALLAGCAGFGAANPSGHGNPQQWRAHKQQLSSLDGWQINGKVGIRAPRIPAAARCSGCNARTTTTFACPARWAAARA
jgi:outer membrane biogenesis lipoprotein LolB